VKRVPIYALLLGAAWPACAMAQSVTTYHGSASRQGAYVVPGLTAAAAASMHRDAGFSGLVDGSVYAQPLFWQAPGARTGQVIVATETNAVYALDGTTGAVAWRTQLAPPVPHGALPCGNIDPEGVTGTPVIDYGKQALYLDASTLGSAGPRHMLYALSLQDGHVLPGWPLDVQAALAAQGVTFSSSVQGERSALLEAAGDVYVSYAGRAGDCGAYHGTVVQVHTAGPAVAAAWDTRAVGGGIWSQAGIAYDGTSLFLATGNTFGAQQWSDGEAILRLRSGLARPASTLDHYTPANWKGLDNSDQDLGGSGATPLRIKIARDTRVGRVIAFGKDGNSYLANEDNLGGIGGPAAVTKVAGGEIISAPAVYDTPRAALVAIVARAATNCSGESVIMLNVAGQGQSPVSQRWCAALKGLSSPIVTTADGVSNPIVWATGAEGDNLLHGFDALTGQVVFAGGGAGDVMSGLRHFQTILAAQGRLYVAADGRIYAFTFPGR
jgi:outer membrane protein assembly factor BamB